MVALWLILGAITGIILFILSVALIVYIQQIKSDYRKYKEFFYKPTKSSPSLLLDHLTTVLRKKDLSYNGKTYKVEHLDSHDNGIKVALIDEQGFIKGVPLMDISINEKAGGQDEQSEKV